MAQIRLDLSSQWLIFIIIKYSKCLQRFTKWFLNNFMIIMNVSGLGNQFVLLLILFKNCIFLNIFFLYFQNNPYSLKESTAGSEMTAWTSAGLQPTTGYYSYDPMSAYG